jgi:iron complex outermembrane receptor protein
LPLVPGVQLFAGSGGFWDDYTVRGFRVWAGTTFRNGFLSGYSGANATDAVNIERVEVVRGPASALYGPGLPGGSINFVTKRPAADSRVDVGMSVARFDTYRGELDATGPIAPGVLYRMTASAESTAGYRDFNDFRRYLVNPVVSLELDRQTWLLAEVQRYGQAYRSDPEGVPILAGNPLGLPRHRSLIEPDQPLAHISGELERVELWHAFSSAWALRVAAQDKSGRYSEYALYPVGLADDGATLSRIAVNWESTSRDTALQFGVRGKLQTGPVQHEVMAGLDLGREIVDYRQGFSDPSVNPYTIDVYDPHYGAPLPDAPLATGRLNRWTYQTGGIYASDIVTLCPELTLLVGARADGYRQESSTSTLTERAGQPEQSLRAGAVYRPFGALAFYANASTGFWPVLGVTATGGVLRPERSRAFELGQRTAIAGDLLTLDAVLFRVDNRNISVPDPNRPDFQVQRGEALSRGLELSATSQVDGWLRVIASYAYTVARITQDTDPNNIGTDLPLTAHHSGGGFAVAEAPKGVLRGANIGGGAVFTSQRPTATDHTELPGYVRFDARLGFRSGRIESTLYIENVLDRRYIRSGTERLGVLYGSPRSVQLSTRASF